MGADEYAYCVPDASDKWMADIHTVIMPACHHWIREARTSQSGQRRRWRERQQLEEGLLSIIASIYIAHLAQDEKKIV